MDEKILSKTKLELNGRVVMPGNQQEVLPWLQAMDIFVLLSYANEGVPQAAIQHLLEDIWLRDHLGKAAERFAREHFIAEAMPDSLDALFKTVRDHHG